MYSTKGAGEGGLQNIPEVFTGKGMPRFKKFGYFENAIL